MFLPRLYNAKYQNVMKYAEHDISVGARVFCAWAQPGVAKQTNIHKVKFINTYNVLYNEMNQTEYQCTL